MKKGILVVILVIISLLAIGHVTIGQLMANEMSADLSAGLQKKISALSDSHPGKRVRGAIELGKMGKEAAPAIPYLIENLGDGAEVKKREGGMTTPGKAAAEALIDIGEAAAPALAQAAKQSGKGQQLARWTLQKIKAQYPKKGSRGGQAEKSVVVEREVSQSANISITATLMVPAPLDKKYDMHFGISHGFYKEIKYGKEKIYKVTQQLDEMGLVWLRHIGRGSTWREIEPERNKWNFETVDAVLHNNEHPWLVIMYGAPGIIYPFRGDLSRETVESQGGKKEVIEYLKKHYFDASDQEQRVDAERFVKKIVGRYKDKIKHWEIGQEGITASGKYDIIKYSYKWIKEADSTAFVLVTAVAGDDEKMFQRGLQAFNEMLAQGLGNYFDIANMHYYGKVDGNFEEKNEHAYDRYKAAMDKYGVRKPIWVTETSTSSEDNSIVSGDGSLVRQAQDMVKRLVIYSAKGADKVFWFNYRQTSAKDKFYGCNIVSHKTGPKPAYYTFKLFVEKIGYYNTVETLKKDKVRLYKFTVPEDNKIVLVAWSQASQTIDVSQYFGSEEVLITHIVEDQNKQPKTEIVSTNKVPVSISPVFIEARS